MEKKRTLIPTRVIRYLPGILGAFFAACTSSQNENADIGLPFYSEATFTPQWIEIGDPGYSDIHMISPFSFRDQNGNIITEEAIEGKVYVANFFFSVCVNVCPKMTTNLLVVQDSFRNDKRLKLLSHTVMPWVDSVETLKAYAKFNGINGDQWHLLTGSKDDVYAIARDSYFADEGFGKTVTEEADFLHTEKIILVDHKRRIRGVYNGTIPLEMKRMIEDIKWLLENEYQS